MSHLPSWIVAFATGLAAQAAPAQPGGAIAPVPALAGPVEARADAGPDAAKKCPPASPGPHEIYHLPVNKKLLDGVSFATDWAQLPSGGWGGQQAMDSCRIRPDGFLTWHGKAAARVEVQPKDDPLALNANSERAEMLNMQDGAGRPINESARSGTQYYATSYYFPMTWRGQLLPWSAFAPTVCSADQNNCNSWSFVLQFYGWGALIAGQTTKDGPQQYSFNGAAFTDGGRIQLGKWTDFVFMVDWTSGAYKVWRRDEGETGFRQVLAGKNAVPVLRDVYIKQGLYRGGRVDGRTDVMWMGPIARGTSFAAVERQAFGTGDGAGDTATPR